jgi:hypothetical protein
LEHGIKFIKLLDVSLQVSLCVLLHCQYILGNLIVAVILPSIHQVNLIHDNLYCLYQLFMR